MIRAKVRDAALVAVTAAATGAAAVAFVLTRHGVLFNPDSASYLWTARLIRADPGRLVDLPGDTSLSIRGSFPPLYPIVLAIVGVAGDDLVAGRILGVVLAAVSAALLVRLVARHSSTGVAVAVAVLAFVSRGFALTLFGFLMTDGLFLVLALGALTLLEPTFRDGGHPRARPLVIGAFVIAALGFGTRLVGAGLVVSVALCVLLLSRGLRPRWRIAAIGMAIGLGPMVAWQAADAGAVGFGGFRLGWYPPVTSFLLAGDSLVWSFAPRPILDLLGPTVVRVVGTVLLAVAFGWSALLVKRAVGPGPTESLRTAAGLLVVGWTHLATIVVSRLIVNPFVVPDGRQTMLWLTCLIAAAGIDVHHRRLGWRSGVPSGLGAGRPAWRWLPAGVAMVLVLAASGPFVRSLRDPSAAWWNLSMEAGSPLAATVAALPGDPVVFTNREDLIYVQTGRPSKDLPLHHLRNSTRRDPMFRDRVRAMADEVRAGRAVVAMYTNDEFWSVPEEELQRLGGLRVTARVADGVILGAVRP